MRAILCATILLITAIPALAAKPTIMVRPDCEISGTTCLLADAATFQNADAATTARLKGVTVCSSPLPGKTRMVTREQIITSLRRAGFADGSVDFLCPAQVSVRRAQSLVTGQQLFDAAKSCAGSTASFPGKVQIEAQRLPLDQSAPSGSTELRVKAAANRLRKGQNSVPVEIVVDGTVYRTVSVSLTVRVIAPVLVATKIISRAEAISGLNTALEEREITMLPDDVLLETPADCTASSAISEGAIIRKQWVVAQAAVKSGDSVLVVVESGGVRVTEKGTAVQDGRPGDRIRIRLAGDVREVRGTVDEPGVVKISLGRRDSK